MNDGASPEYLTFWIGLLMADQAKKSELQG